MQLRSRITVAAAALAVIVPLVMIQGSEGASASTPIRCGTQFGVWPCLQAVSNSTKIIGVNYWAHNPQPVREPGMTLDGGAFHLELLGPGGGFLQNSTEFTLAPRADTRAFTWTAPVHGSGGWGFYCANLWFDSAVPPPPPRPRHELVANRCVDDQP
jgi:hypothetical protein